MQLLVSPASPFVRKVRTLILEAGLSDTVTMTDVSTTPMNTAPEVKAANPLGKIPALIRDDGPALYDSRVITRYLDAQANGTFYPQNRIWDVLTLEATGDAIMEAAVSMTYERRLRPTDLQSDDWIDAQWSKIASAVQAINTRWMSHLAGPLDMSHIAVGCALGYLDLRHPDRGWRTQADALASWEAAFAQRDSMVQTAPPT